MFRLKRKDGREEKEENAVTDAAARTEEVSELVVEKGRRNRRQMIHLLTKWVSCAIAGIFVFLLMIPELPDYVLAADEEEGVRARSIVRENEDAKIGIVYPAEADGWAYSESVRLSEKINSAYDIDADVIPDSGYSRGGDYTLTVAVGYTNLATSPYFSEYLRLGENGYEISHEEDEDGKTWLVSILAFGADACRKASDRFISFFLSKNRLFNSSGSLYVSVTDASIDGQYTIAMAESGFSFLTVSRPGPDEDSLRAFGALTDGLCPDLVVFSGLLTDGCDSRSELTETWSAILSVLSERSVPFTVIPGTGDLADPVNLSILYEILGENDRYVSAFSEDTKAVPLFIAGESDKPYGMILLCSPDCTADDFAGVLGSHIDPVLRSYPDISCTVISPVLPSDAAQALEKAIPESIRIFGSVPASAGPGPKVFGTVSPGLYIGWAGPNCVGSFTAGETAYGLCGSLDFNAEGVGGRYELNNSLRGGFFAKILSDGSIQADPGSVFAADFGAVRR